MVEQDAETYRIVGDNYTAKSKLISLEAAEMLGTLPDTTIIRHGSINYELSEKGQLNVHPYRRDELNTAIINLITLLTEDKPGSQPKITIKR